MCLVPVSVLTRLDTMAEENLRSKYLYKAVLVFIKVIPMLLVFCDVLNTVLCFYGKECCWISFIGGVSFLTLAFLYLVSYLFQFCRYHRMFLHYVTVSNILSIVDLEVGIPISDRCLFDVHCILFGLFLFLVLYFYLHR